MEVTTKAGNRSIRPRWALNGLLLAVVIGSGAALLVIAGAFTGRNATMRPLRSPSATAGSAKPGPTPSELRSCNSSELKASVSTTRADPGLSGGLLSVTNKSANACELRAFSTLQLVSKTGMVIAGEASQDHGAINVTMEPGVGEANVTPVFWQNWCGPDPRPVQVSIVLPNGGGTILSDYGDGSTYLPSCLIPSKPSWFYPERLVGANSLFAWSGE